MRRLADVSPEGEAAWFSGYLPSEMLLGDPVCDAAIHAIQACIPHGTILPVGIDRVRLSPAPLAGPCVVRAQERQTRRRPLCLRSYDRIKRRAPLRTLGRAAMNRVAPTTVAFEWIEPLLGPYFERRLAELVPGTGASIAVIAEYGSEFANGELCNGIANRRLATRDRQSSDRAIAAALGAPTAVHRRPDGKPVCASRSTQYRLLMRADSRCRSPATRAWLPAMPSRLPTAGERVARSSRGRTRSTCQPHRESIALGRFRCGCDAAVVCR